MEHFYHLPHMGEDWFTFPRLYSEMVKRFPDGSHFVEIGAWKGKSSSYMAVEIINSNKQIKFDCIDIWTDESLDNSGYDHNHNTSSDFFYNMFLENIKPVRHIINPIKASSWQKAEDYPDKSIDFIFIDGDHTYDGVKKDLAAWYPKMKIGGVFAGHDYGWTPHIRQAVAELLGDGNYSDPWGCGCFMHEVK
jgi:hypothetical protein